MSVWNSIAVLSGVPDPTGPRRVKLARPPGAGSDWPFPAGLHEITPRAPSAADLVRRAIRGTARSQTDPEAN